MADNEQNTNVMKWRAKLICFNEKIKENWSQLSTAFV